MVSRANEFVALGPDYQFTARADQHQGQRVGIHDPMRLRINKKNACLHPIENDPKLGLTSLRRFLCLVTLGDVAAKRAQQFALRGLDGDGRNFEGKLLAILPQSKDFQASVEGFSLPGTLPPGAF